MMTDKSIDAYSAKYWCVFNNKGFNEILKCLMSEKKINKIGDIDKLASQMKAESDEYFAARGLMPLYEGVVGGATEGILDTMEAFGMHPVDRSATTPYTVDVPKVNLSDKQLKANKDRVEQFRKEYGDKPGLSRELTKRASEDPEHWAVKNTKGYHVDADTKYEHRVGDITKQTSMKELDQSIQNDAIGKDADKTYLDTLKGWFGNALGWFSTVGGAIAVATFIVKTAPYWSQKLKYAFKTLSKTNSVAFCEFEANDETTYRCWFDLKKHAWYLGYGSMKLMQAKSFPSREDVASFFDTQFFQKFRNCCVEHMNAVLENDAVVNAVKSAGGKYGDLLKTIEELRKNKNTLAKNMAGGVYKYQD